MGPVWSPRKECAPPWLPRVVRGDQGRVSRMDCLSSGQGDISFSTWLLSSISTSFPALSSLLLLLLLSSTCFSSHVESGIESTHRTVRVVRGD
ncbi:hypothetical protein PoB_001100200 [Plakobranchus ocellatus]|uniref:Uncharacterized protein n=1 Tax=Plakobranchus ocellatus TaxID=259542 RepID=A0AAV3YNI1_9GAST|nr:hypothetical protein PoB_001100200 [Plakobranchus ocellatus]